MTTAHFISDEWNLVSCVLETKHFPGSHTGVRISEEIRNAVEKLGLPWSKVVAVVHDEAANAELAGRILWEDLDWPSLVCAAHHLQKAIKSTLDQKSLSHILARARHLVGHFKHSPLKMGRLEKKQEMLGMKVVKHVVQDCATRWNSAYMMLIRLVELQTPIQLVLDDMAADKKQLDLPPRNWATCKQLLGVLSYVDEVTKCLG